MNDANNDRSAMGRRAVVERSGFVQGALTLCAMGSLGFAIVGCGGASKEADNAHNCPEGTVLKGSDCVPAESAGHESDDTASSSTSSKGSDTGSSSGSSSSSSSSSDAPAPSSGGSSYDKAYVEGQLKSAARQVKSNCGSATDDSGAAPGPWGKTQASVTLGRNGHVQAVSVPAPYDGQPEGVCAVNAFKKLQFPPYAGSSDAVVPWDIEFVKPKK
jgi:hypothetical protein